MTTSTLNDINLNIQHSLSKPTFPNYDSMFKPIDGINTNDILDENSLHLQQVYNALCEYTNDEEVRNSFWFNRRRAFQSVIDLQVWSGTWLNGVYVHITPDYKVIFTNPWVTLILFKSEFNGYMCDMYSARQCYDHNEINQGVLPILNAVMYVMGNVKPIVVDTPASDKPVVDNDIVEDVKVNTLFNNVSERVRTVKKKERSVLERALVKHGAKPDAINALGYEQTTIVDSLTILGLNNYCDKENDIVITKSANNIVVIKCNLWKVTFIDYNGTLADQFCHYDGRSNDDIAAMARVVNAVAELVKLSKAKFEGEK